ncbi:MAG: hypothetical protein JOZ78_10190 [Chroococcidiopsidaceae cyanobacterium CP_BM_ER_R8_30]|nr:hypothetical protein [Chroococcidiopsidaceae cyanobacterium CP_BM_ER_R8_30]
MMPEFNQTNLETLVEDARNRVSLVRETINETSGFNAQVPIGTYEKSPPVNQDSPKLDVLPPVMTEAEARQCLSEIKGHWTSIRALVLELKERRGWEALGYPNLTACLEAEFSDSRTKLVRELRAAEVEKYVLQVPIGTWPASHFRPLGQLNPEQYKLALDKARELAGDNMLTAVHITKAVKQIAESTRSLKQAKLPKFQPGELVRIKCKTEALPAQKMWNDCWGIVKLASSNVQVLVGGKEVVYAVDDLERDNNCDARFRETCDRILSLWQTELEPIEQVTLKELQHRQFFTDLETQIVSCMETKHSNLCCRN